MSGGQSALYRESAQRTVQTRTGIPCDSFELDEVGHNGSTTWMHAEDPQRVPFDDRAALEELERLRRAIDEWRERRKQVLATFDEFVRGFRTPAAEREVVEPPPTPPGELVVTSDVPEAVHEPPPSPIVDLVLRSSGPSAEQRRRRARLVIVAGGVAVIIATGVLLTRSRHDAPAESSSQRSSPVPPAGTQIPQSTVPPVTPRPDPVEPGSGRTEIIALRRVWVRVIVDGTREVERELRADERVALRPGRTIVIRTGDAGAIRLTMNGQDRGTLGPDGEVVTRTLTAPASANR